LPLNAELLRTVEAVFDKNDIQGVAVLDRAVEAAKAVCLLQTSAARATAFLIGQSLLISNNHAFVGEANDRTALAEDVRGASATFDFEQDSSGQWKRSFSVECKPSKLFYADRELDFVITSVEESDRLPLPASLSGTVDAVPHDDVFIVQHPGGGPKQVVISGNELTEVTDDSIGYLTDTLPGSSGSPVFDRAWRVIALHRAAKSTPDEKGFVENEGSRADVIGETLRRAGFSV